MVIDMCKEEVKCDFRNDLRGCTLKYISEARKMISKGKFKDADAHAPLTSSYESIGEEYVGVCHVREWMP